MLLLTSGKGLQNAVLAITKHVNGLRMGRNQSKDDQSRQRFENLINLNESRIVRDENGNACGLIGWDKLRVNIAGKIQAKNKPKEADFCTLNPNGTIALFYRIQTVCYSDGSIGEHLQYLSFANIWMGSCERDWQKFLSQPNKFYEV